MTTDPTGPTPTPADITAAKDTLAEYLGDYDKRNAVLVGVLRSSIEWITDTHEGCRRHHCSTCAALRHANAYLLVVERVATYLIPDTSEETR